MRAVRNYKFTVLCSGIRIARASRRCACAKEITHILQVCHSREIGGGARQALCSTKGVFVEINDAGTLTDEILAGGLHA